MAKIIVDTDRAKEIAKEWGCGDLTNHILDLIFAEGKELIYCEDCDSAYPCFSPFDRENYVRCTYLATGDGKVVCRKYFCKAGERRK